MLSGLPELLIANDFFSQSNINKGFLKYFNRPEASYSTFYKILKSHREELISLEKYVNEKHNEKFNFKKLAFEFVFKAQEQRKIMGALEFSIEDLRSENKFNNSDEINDIKKRFKISSDEINELKNFIAYIEKFGSPNLKLSIKSFKEYINMLDCINYTYLEFFNDITGYIEFDDLVNKSNFYGLPSNKSLERLQKLFKVEGCNELKTSPELSYYIEKSSDLESKICITSKYNYDNVTVEYRNLNGLLVKTLSKEKVQIGKNYFPLIVTSTQYVVLVKSDNKILLSFNTINF